MNIVKTAAAVAIGALFASAALAQTAASEAQRNVNQQQRPGAQTRNWQQANADDSSNGNNGQRPGWSRGQGNPHSGNR